MVIQDLDQNSDGIRILQNVQQRGTGREVFDGLYNGRETRRSQRSASTKQSCG